MVCSLGINLINPTNKHMKNNNVIRTSAIAGSVSLATILGSNAATILTGESGTNNADVTLNHGSNAAGTANIALAWTVGENEFQIYTGWPTGGDVYQMDDAIAGNNFTVLFTPDSGYNVILTSADINAWATGGSFVLDWAVTGATSGLLASADNVTVADGAVDALNFGATGTSSEALTLTLTMDATSTGTASYLAMDNLSFDQVAATVPEPSSSLLAAVGLGAMAMRRRRK